MNRLRLLFVLLLFFQCIFDISNLLIELGCLSDQSLSEIHLFKDYFKTIHEKEYIEDNIEDNLIYFRQLNECSTALCINEHMSNYTTLASEGDDYASFTLGIIYRHALYNITKSDVKGTFYITNAANNNHFISKIILASGTFLGSHTPLSPSICYNSLEAVFENLMREHRHIFDDVYLMYDNVWPKSIEKNKELSWEDVRDYDKSTVRTTLLQFYLHQNPVPYDKIRDTFEDANYTRSAEIFSPSPAKNTSNFYFGAYLTYRYGLGVPQDVPRSLNFLRDAIHVQKQSPIVFYYMGLEALNNRDYLAAYHNFTYVHTAEIPQPLFYKLYLESNNIGARETISAVKQFASLLLKNSQRKYKQIVYTAQDAYEAGDYRRAFLYSLIASDMGLPYSYSFLLHLYEKMKYSYIPITPLYSNQRDFNSLYKYLLDLSLYSAPQSAAKTLIGKSYYKGEHGYPRDYSMSVSSDVMTAKRMYDQSIAVQQSKTPLVAYFFRLKLIFSCIYKQIRIDDPDHTWHMLLKLIIYPLKDIVITNQCEFFNELDI
ncbi:hypothetical protein WA158_000325 [Blastocystis sp. Blastoise]